MLDRSGSMSGDKIAVARRAADQALAQLAPRDHVALVVFDEYVDVLGERAQASAATLARLRRRLAGVDARGCTDLHAGWTTGAGLLRPGSEATARCLVLTDGLANRGVTGTEAFAAEAERLRAQGVVTSAFGVGEDFDEHLLSTMVGHGGGTFRYLRDASQVGEALVGELGDALAVVVREATLELHHDPDVEVLPLDGRPTMQRGGVTRVALGPVHGEETLVVVLRVRLPGRPLGATVDLEAKVVDADRPGALAWGRVSWTAADHERNDVRPRDVAVDRLVAGAYAQKARLEAVQRNREGDLAGAQRVLRRTAGRIAEYAGADLELRELVPALQHEVERLGAEQLDALTRKRMHSDAERAMLHKDELGRRARPRAR